MLLNQALLTKSIDFLLYMSIIISEEREITKRVIQGMKEMKENLFYKAMYRGALNNGFDDIMKYKDCFRNEIMYTDFNNYCNDMLDDCLAMLRKLNDVYTHEDYIDESMALRVSDWYKAVDELLFDIRHYLISEVNVYPYERLDNYKGKGE